MIEEPGESTYAVNGTIRKGRAEEQKQQLIEQIQTEFARIVEVDEEKIKISTLDVPASWSMEGGEVLPEPGEEADWLESQG